MRLAVITDEVSQDLDIALELASRAGLDGIEIRSVWNRSPDELGERAAERIAAAASARGLAIAAFSSFAFKGPLPQGRAAVRDSRDAFARAIATAQALGTGRIRVFSFCREGPPRPEAAAAAIEPILAAVPTAGLQILIENGTPTNTPTGRHLHSLLGRLGAGAPVTALWDPANSAFSGFEPRPFPADLDCLEDRLDHLHVKEPGGSGGYVPLGQGLLPWPAIIAELRRRDYRSWISLETHWRPDRRFSRQELFKPSGEEFSRGGFSASLRSLETLAGWCGKGRRERE